MVHTVAWCDGPPAPVLEADCGQCESLQGRSISGDQYYHESLNLQACMQHKEAWCEGPLAPDRVANGAPKLAAPEHKANGKIVLEAAKKQTTKNTNATTLVYEGRRSSYS